MTSCSENEIDPDVAVVVIKSRSALAGAGNGGLRFSHLQFLIAIAVGNLQVGVAVGAFRSRTVKAPDAFFPLRSRPSCCRPASQRLGEKCRPKLRGIQHAELVGGRSGEEAVA